MPRPASRRSMDVPASLYATLDAVARQRNMPASVLAAEYIHAGIDRELGQPEASGWGITLPPPPFSHHTGRKAYPRRNDIRG